MGRTARYWTNHVAAISSEVFFLTPNPCKWRAWKGRTKTRMYLSAATVTANESRPAHFDAIQGSRVFVATSSSSMDLQCFVFSSSTLPLTHHPKTTIVCCWSTLFVGSAGLQSKSASQRSTIASGNVNASFVGTEKVVHIFATWCVERSFRSSAYKLAKAVKSLYRRRGAKRHPCAPGCPQFTLMWPDDPRHVDVCMDNWTFT